MATHGVFSDDSIPKINDSFIKEVVVSNTIPLPEEKKSKKIRVLSVAEILAEDIKRTHEGTSMGEYYKAQYKKFGLKGGAVND